MKKSKDNTDTHELDDNATPAVGSSELTQLGESSGIADADAGLNGNVGWLAHCSGGRKTPADVQLFTTPHHLVYLPPKPKKRKGMCKQRCSVDK